jgi:hypothetical protein
LFYELNIIVIFIIFWLTLGVFDSAYYTDLLLNGVDESQDPTPPTDARSQHGHATAKSTQSRSKNFRDEEDILLVSAWLNVAMDPI